MAYLLDSNLVIPYLADDPATVVLVDRLAPQGLAISIITYLEAYQGTLRDADAQLAQEQFEHFLAVVPILPPPRGYPAVGCSALRPAAGRAQASWPAAGYPLGGDRAFDLVIAATALENGYTLVSRIRKDYDDIPDLSLDSFR